VLRKTLLLILALIWCASPLMADGALIQFLAAGLPSLSSTVISGGQVYAYAAGTTTPKSIYTTNALTTAHPQPARLDTNGRLLAYGEGLYKFVIKDVASTTIFTVDNVEARSIQGIFDDPTDPFGDTLTQTTLATTNLTATIATIDSLSAPVGASIASLTIGGTPIIGVGTGTAATHAVNKAQLDAAILAYTPASYSITNAMIASQSVNPRLLDLDYAKFHRVATFTLTTASLWTDVEWDTTVVSETSGISLISPTTIQLVDAAHYKITGCTRPRWTGDASTVALVASRIVYSTDGGSTWDEARCLQAISGREHRENEVGTLPYHGSISVPANAQVKLQVQVSNVSMLLAGWPGFDNPVAASIDIQAAGYYNP